MRLLTFEKAGAAALGVGLEDGSVVDLAAADPALPADWPTVLGGGLLDRVRQAAEAAPRTARLPGDGLAYLAPVPRPSKIIGIGLNYRAHAAETGMAIPEYPIVFARFPTSLVGPERPIVRPAASEQYDYEAELAVVIGRRARHLTAARALDCVAGYSIINEGSVRDFQFKSHQWTMGKNFDASGAFGPWIVTADSLPAGAVGLRIAARLNGTTVQDSNTSDMIFDVPSLISALSEAMTLEPGDVIATGTPEGVGLGRKPPLWMKPGDICEIEIEGIGVLRNPVVAEPEG